MNITYNINLIRANIVLGLDDVKYFVLFTLLFSHLILWISSVSIRSKMVLWSFLLFCFFVLCFYIPFHASASFVFSVGVFSIFFCFATKKLVLSEPKIKFYRPFDTISDGDFSIDIFSSVSSFYVLFPGSKNNPKTALLIHKLLSLNPIKTYCLTN